MVIQEGTESATAPETGTEQLNQQLAEEAAEFIARQVLDRGATFNDG
jgi:hypothetical protein